jgi:hypothetical protein
MALGADPGAIFKMVLRQGFSIVGFGVVAGLAIAFASTRLLTDLIVGVRPSDRVTYVTVATSLIRSFVCLLAPCAPCHPRQPARGPALSVRSARTRIGDRKRRNPRPEIRAIHVSSLVSSDGPARRKASPQLNC